MTKVRKKTIVAIPLALVLGVVINQVVVIPEKRISLGKNQLYMRVADTEKERIKGLSGKKWMKDDVGMYFKFEDEDYHAFWMKEMKFGLDFIWVDKGEVVDITSEIEAPKNKAEEMIIYKPSVPVDGVIEVNDGWVEKTGVRVGDKLGL